MSAPFAPASLSAFDAALPTGARVSLSRFAGEVTLVVNTASECRYTDQYRGLEALHRRYAGDGFSVLAFPCNQFGAQESGSDAEIARFCAERYQVSFPVFARIDLVGERAHPLYRWLRTATPGAFGGSEVRWNFTKYLLDRTGTPVVRYAPSMEPEHIAPAIERLLRQGTTTPSPGKAAAAVG